MPEVFDTARPEHARTRAELASLLTPAEMAAAARNTLNAHYTDAALVQVIWSGVQQLGFAGGQVLEPGCGSGNFIAFAPAGASVTGIELEPVTAQIAATLYPDAQIRAESFADTRIPEGSFDLGIGNVPFGAIRLTDRRHNRGSHSIHGHFIIKSLHLTRPGGLVAVLTSRFTLDARNPAVRREIAGLADLVGAVRLPSGAHQRAAGTAVVTDLLILRRREAERDHDRTTWERAKIIDLDGAQVPVNEYFLDHPNHVLGELRAVNGAYRTDDLVVTPVGDTISGLTETLQGIAGQAHARGLGWSPASTSALQPVQAPSPPAEGAGLPDGYLRARPDGSFTVLAGGQEEPHPVPGSQARELRQLLSLRDQVLALLEAEAATVDDTPALEQLRTGLNRGYEAYVRAYGPVNRFSWRRTGRLDPHTGTEKLARVRPRQGGFRTDPFAPVVQALEQFDPVSQQAAKATIFSRRLVAPRNPRLGADGPADALAICLDLCGEIRLPAIARLLGIEPGQAREELGTLVFDDPHTGRLVPAAEYLSGNVRARLRAAESAAADDPRFAINAAELRAVLPAELAPAEISARLGAAWIDAAVVGQFLREILDDPTIKVEHPGGQVWAVTGNKNTILATSTWGTSRYPTPQLARAVLEQRRIEVRDKVGNDAWVLNMDETLAAQQKAAELAERFAEWAWEDPARAETLARTYNETFNSIVLRNYDDAQLSLPGLALDFEPRAHQVAAVARIINEPAVGLFHEVGAGKTAEITMGAMELRRLGLASKPAIIVPNHMLEQFGREFLQLYPQARILVAQPEDLETTRRRLFIARCATGDWDAIIVSRSAFERIPMSPQAQQAYADRELDRIREWLARSKDSGGLTVKRLEAALLRASEKLKAKLDSAKDPGISFEATGIDYLFVDEAHGYKNLRTVSNIPDAAIDGSMRATDLDMKISYLREKKGQRVVTFATATPIANSITEVYVMQHYLRPDLLRDAGIEDFDAWAATFAETVSQIELAPEGGTHFRQKTRFARFVNVPELLKMWHVSADIKTGADLDLPTPDLARRAADGERAPETVIVPPPEALLAYVADLGERADKIRGHAVSPEEDNMLKVTGDGRKAALDLRLVGLPAEPGKIEAAAARITAIWREHHDDIYPDPDGRDAPVRGSLQIVFCDLGTPGGGWNVYDELRDQLTIQGLPRRSVRFIHEARNDREKGELFAACRNGSVAVLIGSTERMGVGTNIQARAVALHHLDCPWRPADVAQREGRILRQGNLNSEVQILRFATGKSFDGFMWQTVERKARFIGQVMRGRLDIREIEDIGDAALSYSEVKALATGNPLLMDKAEADAELTRLERAVRAHHRNQDTLRYRMAAAERHIGELTALASDIDTAISRRQPTRGDLFTMTVGAGRLDNRRRAGERLATLIQQHTGALTENGQRSAARIGMLGGFEVMLTVGQVLGSVQITVGLDGAPGAEVRLSGQDLIDADPAGLVIRLENRLNGLEAFKAKTIDDIDRLRTEMARAGDDIRKPFTQASQLTAARERLRQVNDLLTEAAKPPQPSEGEAGGVATVASGTDAAGLDGKASAADGVDGQAARPNEELPHDPVRVSQRSFPAHNLLANQTNRSPVATPGSEANPSRNMQLSR